MNGPDDHKARKSPKKPQRIESGSLEANRLAVLILEVLAGSRTPLDAAKALGVRLPRYYQLETRALRGLIAALEPRPKVRQPSPEGRIARLEKALGEARRDSLRQQALVRAAQRSLGIKPAMFYRLRTEVLEAGLARLEPRPIGRPPRSTTAEERKCEGLQLEVEELQDELQLARVREEIAHVMPHLVRKDGAKKKRPIPHR